MRADTVSSASKIQRLLETTSCQERLRESLVTLTSARDVLRLRQRLKDLVDERDVGENATEDGEEDTGVDDGEEGDTGGD